MGSGKTSLLSSVFLRFAIFFSLSLSLFLFSASSIGIKDDKALHFSLNDELGHDYTFPKGFKWGTATAAYQVEGAYDKDGRGPSIWDTFTHTPGKIRDSSTGDHADDHYNQMEQDVELMRNMGVHVYRFSLSWSRIFPKGEGEVNRKGVEFYNQLIDSLLKRGIEPFITLYHWDLPQALEDKYGGWLSNVTSKKFEEYAEFCFREFGDRVKYWLTLNEPHSFAVHGYVSGWHAPGRCSNRLICAAGNTSTEPYIVTHNALLAHAMAVDVYRKKFAPTQKGKIGITLDISNYEPYDPENPKDVEAVERAYAWHGAWFADPVYFGDYPKVMKERVGDRLPVFTEEEKKLIKGSSDFFGLNHYTSSYVIHQDEPTEEEGYYRDRGCLTTSERDGKLIGPRGEPTWLFVVPRGFRAVLNWVWKRYEKPDIYITENGVSAPHESLLSVEVALEDEFRVGYYRDYIKEMSKAINEDGVNVLGYMAWSLFDNFEWADGYEKRFGLFYVNYNSTKYERYPKKSAKWYSKLIAST